MVPAALPAFSRSFSIFSEGSGLPVSSLLVTTDSCSRRATSEYHLLSLPSIILAHCASLAAVFGSSLSWAVKMSFCRAMSSAATSLRRRTSGVLAAMCMARSSTREASAGLAAAAAVPVSMASTTPILPPMWTRQHELLQRRSNRVVLAEITNPGRIDPTC